MAQLKQKNATKVQTTTVNAKPKRHKPRAVTVLLDSDDLVREQVGGFANFLREYAIVGLALGFIVGQQANGVVKQLVASFMDPIFKVWFGQDLSTRTVNWHHNGQAIPVHWGAFVYILLELFFVLISIYLVVKFFRLDRLKKIEDKK